MTDYNSLLPEDHSLALYLLELGLVRHRDPEIPLPAYIARVPATETAREYVFAMVVNSNDKWMANKEDGTLLLYYVKTEADIPILFKGTYGESLLEQHREKLSAQGA